MKNSHLAAVLRTLSKREVREIRKWLQSPAHNQREDVVDLFEYLCGGSRLENDKYLDKEWVFRKIFPGEEYDDAKIRQSMHFLLKAIEEFLTIQELCEDDVRAKIALAGVFRKRKLDRAFKKTMRSVSNMQRKHPYRNPRFLQNNYLMERERYGFLEHKKRTVQMNLQEVSDALDTAFIADKLRQSCLMRSHQLVYKTEYETGLLTQVLNRIENGQYLDIPAIAIYYYTYKTLANKENPHFFERLKEQIRAHESRFPLSEMRDIYLMAINYCIGRMNAGRDEFIREAFELYRRGLNREILIENGIVSRFTFLNVLRIAMRLREFDWASEFIPAYKDHLDGRHRENIFHYSQARLHFEKKDYDSAMRLLIHADFDDILLQLNAKTMLFKMYYELDELDALESLLESLRTYMHRKQVMGYHKANYQNIIKYTRKLIRINPYSSEQKDKLEQEIQTAKPLTERDWLLRQLASA
ncbi:MAG: hypothetical protein R3350_03145 [Saprospiraceae bacterium]|nr:hypothetical protein [Saprospiraceae bacterium]